MNGEGQYLFIGGGTCLVDGEKLIGSSVRKSNAFVYDTWNMGLMSVMRVLLGQSMADDDLPYSLALRVELNVMGKESFQFGSSAKKSMMQHLYIGYEDVVHGWKIRAIQVGCPTGEDLKAIDTVDIRLDEGSPNEDTGDSHKSGDKPMENKTEWTKKGSWKRLSMRSNCWRRSVRENQIETLVDEDLGTSEYPAEMNQKGFIYSFVAKGTVVLAEHTSYSGNFSTIAVQCLQKLPSNSSKFTYSCDGHTFNFLIDNGFVFLVVADESVGRSVPFVFLERDRFSIAYNLDREFGPRLKEHMQYCMNHPEEMSKLSKLKAQITEVKGIMMDNIEKVLDRGEKIELLVDKTENLQFQADSFQRQGRQLRRRMWLQNLQMKLMHYLAV
ncbi:hypothetical protein GOBAR_DD04121 [Gossypium barbadense]|nr:hypothetical protein GOBAR_DD04121 [Gossypium barbadense]